MALKRYRWKKNLWRERDLNTNVRVVMFFSFCIKRAYFIASYVHDPYLHNGTLFSSYFLWYNFKSSFGFIKKKKAFCRKINVTNFSTLKVLNFKIKFIINVCILSLIKSCCVWRLFRTIIEHCDNHTLICGHNWMQALINYDV